MVSELYQISFVVSLYSQSLLLKKELHLQWECLWILLLSIRIQHLAGIDIVSFLMFTKELSSNAILHESFLTHLPPAKSLFSRTSSWQGKRQNIFLRSIFLVSFLLGLVWKILLLFSLKRPTTLERKSSFNVSKVSYSLWW